MLKISYSYFQKVFSASIIVSVLVKYLDLKAIAYEYDSTESQT